MHERCQFHEDIVALIKGAAASKQLPMAHTFDDTSLIISGFLIQKYAIAKVGLISIDKKRDHCVVLKRQSGHE